MICLSDSLWHSQDGRLQWLLLYAIGSCLCFFLCILLCEVNNPFRPCIFQVLKGEMDGTQRWDLCFDLTAEAMLQSNNATFSDVVG